MFRRNIWTKSNILLDLCRYLGVQITLYRHPETDFIVSYHRQPPFDISKEIYTMCHPVNLMLSKHKIIIPSKFTNPKGKIKVKKFIKPPKQMLNKWFFQEHFCKYPLLMIQAAACNLNYSNLGCCNTNQMVTFYYLNIGFYSVASWTAVRTDAYLPYSTFISEVYTWNKKQWDTLDTAKPDQKFTRPSLYAPSVNIKTGFFSPQMLQAVQLTSTVHRSSIVRNVPLNICRYNPNLDNGKKSKIWLVSTHTASWDPPPIDKTLVYEGYPLYMMLYGFLSYVQYIKKASDFFLGYVVALQSPALLPYSQVGAEKNIIVPLDSKMPQGKAPYDEDLTDYMKNNWFPTVYNQLEVLNTIVESGPLVPKYSQTKNSTWELDMFYKFIFKWGGPESPEPIITDPMLQATYEVPDTYTKTLQIVHPRSQKAGSLLQPWDIRRGYFTKTALKRMQENLPTDSSIQSDAEQPARKKKKTQTGPELSNPFENQEEIQTCLHSLCEENIFQEIPEDPKQLSKLIKQQQEQQQQLKYNILRIISELKEKQNLLSLQTGAVL